MLDRLKIGTHITLFPEWLIEWEYRAMDFDVGAEWIFSVNSESGEIEALEAVEGSIERTLRILESEDAGLVPGSFTLCNKSDKALSNNRAWNNSLFNRSLTECEYRNIIQTLRILSCLFGSLESSKIVIPFYFSLRYNLRELSEKNKCIYFWKKSDIILALFSKKAALRRSYYSFWKKNYKNHCGFYKNRQKLYMLHFSILVIFLYEFIP